MPRKKTGRKQTKVVRVASIFPFPLASAHFKFSAFHFRFLQAPCALEDSGLWKTNFISKHLSSSVFEYSHALHNDVLVQDEPHMRRWPHKVRMKLKIPIT